MSKDHCSWQTYMEIFTDFKIVTIFLKKLENAVNSGQECWIYFPFKSKSFEFAGY